MDIDLQVRLAAFNWLSEQVNVHGDVLYRDALLKGFEFQGQRVPLIYLHGLQPSRYLPVYPVYIVGDDPKNLTFHVSVDDPLPAFTYSEASVSRQIAEVSDARPAYITSTVKVRLLQRSFREKVLDAYRSQCAFCRLKHRELLDAAHIIPDNLPEGRSTIQNGLSLCKLHHAAFDSFMIGVTPDYVIHVREDILDEEDGPVLQHGLQGLHKIDIAKPAKALSPRRLRRAPRHLHPGQVSRPSLFRLRSQKAVAQDEWQGSLLRD